jgi:hypothetical protein
MATGAYQRALSRATAAANAAQEMSSGEARPITMDEIPSLRTFRGAGRTLLLLTLSFEPSNYQAGCGASDDRVKLVGVLERDSGGALRILAPFGDHTDHEIGNLLEIEGDGALELYTYTSAGRVIRSVGGVERCRADVEFCGCPC